MAKYEARARIEKVKTGSGATRYYVEREFKHDGVWRGFETITGLEEWEAKREAARTPKTVDIEDGTERQHTKSKVQNDYAASARNAKFKVGDKVKYIGTKHGAPYGKTLTVVREPDAVGRYIVRWPSDHAGFMAVGSEGFAWEKELVAANSARNAKFKVGDKIKIVADTGAWRKGEKGTVIGGDYLPGYFFVKFDGGTEGRIPEEKMAVANSRAAKNDADPYLSEKLKLMIRHGAISEAAGGKPMPGDVVFEYRGKRYYTDKDSAHMVKQFSDAGLVKMHNSCGVRSSNAAVQAALNSAANAERGYFYGTVVKGSKVKGRDGQTYVVLHEYVNGPYAGSYKVKDSAGNKVLVPWSFVSPNSAAANTDSHNARPLGKGEILRRGDYVETPWDGAIGCVVGVKILDRDKGSAVYKVKMEKTGTFFDFPGHHLKVV